MHFCLSQVSCSNSSTVKPGSGSDSLISPVGSFSRSKSLTNSSLCSESTTSSFSSLTSHYPRAPGFEREDQVHRLLFSALEPMQHSDSTGPNTYCLRSLFYSFLIHYLPCHHFQSFSHELISCVSFVLKKTFYCILSCKIMHIYCSKHFIQCIYISLLSQLVWWLWCWDHSLCESCWNMHLQAALKARRIYKVFSS